jgi:hypothetical protein
MIENKITLILEKNGLDKVQSTSQSDSNTKDLDIN